MGLTGPTPIRGKPQGTDLYAISRLLGHTSIKTTIIYRDRQRNSEVRKMTLDAQEFIRRFLLHVLPAGFIKIRYFGFLSHTNKNEQIPLIRKLIDPDADLPEKISETVCEMMLRLTGEDITCCPKCKRGKMVRIRTLQKEVLNTS